MAASFDSWRGPNIKAKQKIHASENKTNAIDWEH